MRCPSCGGNYFVPVRNATAYRCGCGLVISWLEAVLSHTESWEDSGLIGPRRSLALHPLVRLDQELRHAD